MLQYLRFIGVGMSPCSFDGLAHASDDSLVILLDMNNLMSLGNYCGV